MRTPIPTPFDIIEPPPGPLIPSGTTWLALVLITVLGVAATRWFNRASKAKTMDDVLQNLVEELHRRASSAASHSDLERITRLAKRIVAAYTPTDPAGLSPVELRSTAAVLRASMNDTDRSTAVIVELIADIEELTYAPSTDDVHHHTLVSNLVTNLSNQVRRPRPS